MHEIPDLAGVSLLVVDDNVDTCEMLRTALTCAGASVRTASSAPEALQTLDGPPVPDALLTDLLMPGRDGLWLAREVHRRSHHRDLPVIGITGRPLRRLPASWPEGDFAVVVAKPIDPMHLGAIVLGHVKPSSAGEDADGDRPAPPGPRWRRGGLVRHVGYPWAGEVMDVSLLDAGYAIVRWRTGSAIPLEACERLAALRPLVAIAGGGAVSVSPLAIIEAHRRAALMLGESGLLLRHARAMARDSRYARLKREVARVLGRRPEPAP